MRLEKRSWRQSTKPVAFKNPLILHYGGGRCLGGGPRRDQSNELGEWNPFPRARQLGKVWFKIDLCIEGNKSNSPLSPNRSRCVYEVPGTVDTRYGVQYGTE